MGESVRLSPTPSARSMVASLSTTPTPLVTPTMLESRPSPTLDTMATAMAMASVRPRLRLSPTPSARSMVVSPSTMPTPLVTPTMLDIPATSPMAMVDIPSTDKFHVGCRTFWRNLSQTPERFTLVFSPITAEVVCGYHTCNVGFTHYISRGYAGHY